MNSKSLFRAAFSLMLTACAPGAHDLSAARVPELSAVRENSVMIRGEAASNAALVRPQVVLAEYRGHYDASTGRLSFARGMAVRGATPRPGYTQILSNSVSLEDNGTSVFGAVPFAGGTCSANQVCAVVTVTNDTAVQIDEARVEFYDVTGGATLVATDALGTNYPSTAGTAGGWTYGSLTASGGQASKTWRIATAAGADFDFRVAVWGTYTRTSYVASDVLALAEAKNPDSADAAWSDSAPAWRDACVEGTQIMAGVTSFTTAYRTPLFPSAIYGTAINTDGWANTIEVSSAGTIGIGGVSSGTNALLSSAGASDYTFYPFWDALEATNGQVCVGVDSTSTAPNRRYVATWKNVNVSGFSSSRLTFSVVLQERTDNVWFLYHQWMTGASGCSTSGTGSSNVRGGGATVGVRGNTGAQITTVSHDTTFLPLHASSPCPGDGAYIALTATPVNPS